jgi:putative membrane protein
MLSSLLTLLATALSLLVVDIIFPGVDLATFPAALFAAAILGLVNALIRPVLSALSLPLTFVTFGGFSLVVNGLCFWLASLFVPGFRVAGLLSFLFAPVLLSLVNTFINNYLGERYPQFSLGASKEQKELPE